MTEPVELGNTVSSQGVSSQGVYSSGVSVEGGPVEPVRALVVDDSMPMRLTLCAMLRDMGMVVTEADDGERALEELAASSYDLVFIDWYMPGIDGLELVRRIRGGSAGADALIVMVTSECEDHHIALAIEAGVDEYVTKPFDRLTFEAKLDLIGCRRRAG